MPDLSIKELLALSAADEAPPVSNVFATREEWLNAFIRASTPIFAANGYTVPPAIRASIGFPSTGRSGKRIGECWASICSADGTFEIFLTPTLDAPARIADILTHEVIHAVVGLDAGHKKPFKQCATKMGLGGKMTATVATPAWHAWADPILADLGPMPHASLNTAQRKKQTTRMLKVTCGECDIVFRISAKHADRCRKCPDDDCEGFLCVDSGDGEEG